MHTLATVIHILTCVLLVLVVLLQSGKGAEISASFGGSSQTVFGTSGGANFFTRFTSVLAAVFMITSVGLSWLGTQSGRSVMEGEVSTAPASTGVTGPTGAVAPAAQTPASSTPSKK